MQWAKGFFRLWLVLTAVLSITAGIAHKIPSAVHVLVWKNYRPPLCAEPNVLKAVEGWKVSANPDVVANSKLFSIDCSEFKAVDHILTKEIPQMSDWNAFIENEQDEYLATSLIFAANRAALASIPKLKVEKARAEKSLWMFFNDAIVPSFWMLIIGIGLTWALRGFRSRVN
jgi:hypothetical protein